MPRTAHRDIEFPIAGVVRRYGYRDYERKRPYSAPWAVNVRGVGVLEGRERGGSRPGLIPVDGVETSGLGVWAWPNGVVLEWETETEMTYDYTEDAITAPDGSKIINPASLIKVSAETGSAPSDYTISCVYRDRVILGKGNLWYASRVANPTDWDFGADMGDETRAVAGTVELAGVTGLDLTAIIPHRDKALFLATANSLHVLQGDPATGTLQLMDDDNGIIAPYGWAFNGEVLAFLSNDGVYIGGIGEVPQRFSEGRIPNELKNIDVSSNTVTMAYDPGARGFHLFITPSTGSGKHYFLDIENKAIWPVVFGNEDHQPVIAARIKNKKMERVVLKGRDGEWREFSADAYDDDGTALISHVLLGPIMIAPGDSRDAMVAEIYGIMADGLPGTVTFGIVMGSSAESAADAAVADVEASLMRIPTSSVAASGLWTSGRNDVKRPRCRGSWVVVWISSDAKWAYEAVSIVVRQLGRNRE